MSKNMADYTNFQYAKTNKKIMHPPGGATTFSLGWANHPTDYQPHKTQAKGYNHQE